MRRAVRRLSLRALIAWAGAAVSATAAISSNSAHATSAATTVTTPTGISWSIPSERYEDVRFTTAASGNAISTVFVLRNSTAPAAYSFTFNLREGEALVPSDNGEVDVVRTVAPGIGWSVAHVDAPWAVDANGNSLDSWFTTDGSRLVQTVQLEGAAFPVTADPKITWGWITGTVYFNKSETRKLAAANTAAGVLAAALPPPFKAAIVPLGALAVRAQWAIADNKCIKIKLPSLRIDSYRGGYCK